MSKTKRGGVRPGAGRTSKRIDSVQLNIAIEREVHDYIRAQALAKNQSPADWVENLARQQMKQQKPDS